MSNESINDKLKKLITKVNSIQGSLLSMGKRLTALEEKKESTYTPDDTFLNYLKGYMFGNATPWILEEEVELIPEAETIAIVDPIPTEEPEDEISQETLDALDEVIE